MDAHQGTAFDVGRSHSTSKLQLGSVVEGQELGSYQVGPQPSVHTTCIINVKGRPQLYTLSSNLNTSIQSFFNKPKEKQQIQKQSTIN